MLCMVVVESEVSPGKHIVFQILLELAVCAVSRCLALNTFIC